MGTPFCGDLDRVEGARYRFLQAIRDVLPAALYDLRDVVFPVYSQWVAERLKELSTAEPAKAGAGPEFRTFLLIEKAAPAVAASITDWCRRHNLIGTVPAQPEDAGPEWNDLVRAKAMWPERWVSETLWAWQFWPDGAAMREAQPPEWVRVDFFRGFAGIPTFRFRIRVPAWSPEFETRAAFRRRVTDRVDRLLDAYLSRRLSGGGLRGERNQYQWKWVALRQVAGMTYPQIADQQAGGIELAEDTVRKAVEAKADLIGLALRPGATGPDRKPET